MIETIVGLLNDRASLAVEPPKKQLRMGGRKITTAGPSGSITKEPTTVKDEPSEDAGPLRGCCANQTRCRQWKGMWYKNFWRGLIDLEVCFV